MALSMENIMPAVQGLAGIAQNPVYHGEGDVLVHTRLVMEELQKLPGFLRLCDADRETLLAAAALHDLGKKVCTVMEHGQWVSPNHSSTGAKMARELLITVFGLCGTPEAVNCRETICALVRWHMKPLHILSLPDPGRAVRKMSSLGELAAAFSVEKLALLSEADNLGRVCDDKQEQLDTVALFRELSREEACYQRPYVYADLHSRYADLSERSSWPGQPVHNNSWGTVIMMSGLPGTGKDTYLSQNYPQMPMVSLDIIRREMGVSPAQDDGVVAQRSKEQARQLLRNL